MHLRLLFTHTFFIWHLLVTSLLQFCIEAYSGFGVINNKKTKNNYFNNNKVRDTLYLSISSFDYETQNKLPWLESGYKVRIYIIYVYIIYRSVNFFIILFTPLLLVNTELVLEWK